MDKHRHISRSSWKRRMLLKTTRSTAWRDLGPPANDFQLVLIDPIQPHQRGCTGSVSLNCWKKPQGTSTVPDRSWHIIKRRCWRKMKSSKSREPERLFKLSSSTCHTYSSKSGSLSMFAPHVFPVRQVFQCQKKFFAISKEHSGY